MITLTITVDNITNVLLVYDQVRIQRAASETGTFAAVVGLGPVTLAAGQGTYTETDADGTATNWYRSQYYNSITFGESSWTDPVLGETGDLFSNPTYPDEVSYGTSQQLVIDRIRRLAGDPIGLRRDYGEDALSSIHTDNKTYQLYEKGWPVSITINLQSYTNSSNPTVDGYTYLRFQDDISLTTTVSGVEYGVDIYYNTFRHSDRQIMEAYDSQPPPPPLTTTTANSEVYMLATAIEILEGELWEDATEDGAAIKDEGSSYNPEPGLNVKEKRLNSLRKRLDDMIKALQMPYVGGVLID
jgi:hypothetical protein